MIHKFATNLVYANFFRLNFTTAPAGIGKTKKKLGKFGAALEKVTLPVETDAQKLVKFVCGSNILKDGKDIELKPDSDYPDWLWKINTGKPKPLEEMDPETKAYWIRVRKMAMVRNNKLSKIKKF